MSAAEQKGILVRLAALQALIKDQELYLAQLRIREERLNSDLRIAKRQ